MEFGYFTAFATNTLTAGSGGGERTPSPTPLKSETSVRNENRSVSQTIVYTAVTQGGQGVCPPRVTVS